MTIADLRDMTVEDLQQQLENTLDQQFKLNIQKATGALTQTHEISQNRRHIARIKTILNEKSRKQMAS